MQKVITYCLGMKSARHPGYEAAISGDYAKSGAYGVQVYGALDRAQSALSRLPREGMGHSVVLFNAPLTIVCTNRVASMFVRAGYEIAR
jgi:hypothetical protein